MNLRHTHPALFEVLEDNLDPLSSLIWSLIPDGVKLVDHRSIEGDYLEEGDTLGILYWYHTSTAFLVHVLDLDGAMQDDPSASFSYGYLLAISQMLDLDTASTVEALQPETPGKKLTHSGAVCLQCGSSKTSLSERGYDSSLICRDCGAEEHRPGLTKEAYREQLEVPGPDSCAACDGDLTDYERLHGDGSCLSCFTS